MRGLNKQTRVGVLALIVVMAGIFWFVHRGRAFTLIENPAEQLSGLVSFTASQNVRANVVNRWAFQAVTAHIKFCDIQGNTIGTDVVVPLAPHQSVSFTLTSGAPGAAAGPTFGPDGTAKIRAVITVTAANTEMENASLGALIGLLEVFNTSDGVTTVAVPAVQFKGASEQGE
jgi:hypothetical protein